MTKAAALHQFFSSFGMAAYTATSVPEDSEFPYLTYELITSAWGAEEVGMTVNLWFYTESEAIPNAKAEELSRTIGLGGKVLPCDGGFIWIKRGSPWCQSLSDETSPDIKRRLLNVTAEYLTKN